MRKDHSHQHNFRVVPAGRVDIVSSGIVGVDGAVERVVLRAVKGILVEAFLRHHPVGVVQVVAAAEEELDVALQGFITVSQLMLLIAGTFLLRRK